MGAARWAWARRGTGARQRWEAARQAGEACAGPAAGPGAGGPEPGCWGGGTGHWGRRHPGNNVRRGPTGPAEHGFLLQKVRRPPVPGELPPRQGAEPAGRGAAAPHPRASAIWVRTRRPRRRTSGPAATEPLPARRFPPSLPARRFPVLGPRSSTAEKPVQRAQVRAEGRGRLGWPRPNAARGVRRAEAALPVAAAALPGHVDGPGPPHSHALGLCCSLRPAAEWATQAGSPGS